jgi:hypothetical protein
VGTRINRPRSEEWRGAKTEEAMSEYRIGEMHRRFHIEQKTGKEWHDVRFENVPRFFDSLADARSWVATIKRGVVYHDAEDAPNLPVDERKVEDDTSDGVKPLEWFEARVGKTIYTQRNWGVFVASKEVAKAIYQVQYELDTRYFDLR